MKQLCEDWRMCAKAKDVLQNLGKSDLTEVCQECVRSIRTTLQADAVIRMNARSSSARKGTRSGGSSTSSG